MQQSRPTHESDRNFDTLAALLDAHQLGAPLGELFDVPTEHVEQAEAFGYRLYQQGDYRRAEQLARGLVALDDERLYPHLLLGEVLLKGGQHDETLRAEDAVDARAAFERVLELESTHDTAAIKLARLHLHADTPDRARPLLASVLDRTDNDTLRSEAEVLMELASG
jgi:predicted Zn-dependent protease